MGQKRPDQKWRENGSQQVNRMISLMDRFDTLRSIENDTIVDRDSE